MKYSKRTLIGLSIVSSLAIVGVASAATGALPNWIQAINPSDTPSASSNVSTDPLPTAPLSIPTTGTTPEPPVSDPTPSVSTSPSQAPSDPLPPITTPSTVYVAPEPTAVDPGNGQVMPALTDQQRQDVTVTNPGH